MKIAKFLPLLLLVLLCSCAFTGLKENAQSGNINGSKEASEEQITSVPTIEDVIDKNRFDYIIRGKDILYITVYDEPELSFAPHTNRSLRVSIEGTISFPLIGDVPVAGLTPFQLEKKLEQLLSEGYLVNPNVSVVVGEYHGSVHVFGQVKNPGVIKLVDKDVTVVEAISMSGGFTDIASPNRTYIIRKENGVDKTIYVKVNKVIKGKKGKGIILKPDDVVVVPEAFF